MAKTYDQKCYELACHFTQDLKHISPYRLGLIRSEMALVIQQAVEDHLHVLPQPGDRAAQ